MALPELPTRWGYVTPEAIVREVPNALAIGPFGSNLKVSDYTDEGVPLVFVRHIRARQFDGLNPRFVSQEKAADLAAHVVVSGDVLVTKMGDPPGDAAVYPEQAPPAVITADCIRIAVEPAIANPRFVAMLFETDVVKRQVLALTKGVAQKKVWSSPGFPDVSALA